MKKITLPHKPHIYLLLVIFSLILIFFSGYSQIKKIYHDYWGSENQVPQGTIYSVQTVQFNIANSSMPITAAQAIMEKNEEYLQQITESAYGLSGFVITECQAGSNAENCLGERPIAHTTLGFNWLNEKNLEYHMGKSDFTNLTSDGYLGIDWRYRAAKYDEIIDLSFSPPGEIIGRLYYVRRPPPSFLDQWKTFSSRLWNADNMATKYYMSVVSTHSFLFIITAFSFVFLYRKGVAEHKAKQDRKALEDALEEEKIQAIKIKEEKDFSEKRLASASRNISELESEKEIEKQRYQELKEKIDKQKESIINEKSLIEKDKALNDELLSVMEKELQEREDILKEKESFYKQSLLEKSILKEEIENKDKKLKEAEFAVDRLRESIARKRAAASLSEKAVEAFIRGLNITSKNFFNVHQDVYEDIKRLEKSKAISYEAVISTISRIAKTDSSDSSFSRTFEALHGFDNVYHSKRQKIRIYFKRTNSETEILGIWEQSEAPHKRNDKHWRTLRSRFS